MRSTAEPVEGTDGAGWARWSPAGALRPWTVGVEEEALLLDAATGGVVNGVDEVLERLAPALAARASAETHACVLELKTGPHATVADAVAELAASRRSLATVLAARRLCAAAAGTHPLARRSQVAISAGSRYRRIDATMRALARREPTLALHVHVAVPDGPTGVRALNGLRAELPLLLALSANSPFWRGADSGFASIRTPVFSMFPRTGIPRRFASYAAYVRVVDALLRTTAIPDPSFLWWDARLRPGLGAVEVRIADAQSRIEDVAALAAFVQCAVRHHATARSRPPDDPEVLAESRFLAARDGMDAALFDVRTGRSVRARDAVTELVRARRPEAAQLGCED